jgi:hypothetical protein
LDRILRLLDRLGCSRTTIPVRLCILLVRTPRWKSKPSTLTNLPLSQCHGYRMGSSFRASQQLCLSAYLRRESPTSHRYSRTMRWQHRTSRSSWFQRSLFTGWSVGHQRSHLRFCLPCWVDCGSFLGQRTGSCSRTRHG